MHKKRKQLLITNINHNIGDSVTEHNLGGNVAEGTVSEPKFHFQHWQDKIQHLQTPQKTPNEQKTRIFKEIKLISHSVKRWNWIQKKKKKFP